MTIIYNNLRILAIGEHKFTLTEACVMLLPEIGRGKSEFIAKSSMSFAQFIGTAGLATRLFGEFSIPWKLALVSVMLALITLSLSIYPADKKGEK